MRRYETHKMQNMKSVQGGAVLIVSLIMLLLITAIAVSTISGSTFQTSMAINTQQRQLVLRAAESASEQPLTDAILVQADRAFQKWEGSGNASDRIYDVPTTKLTAPDETDSVKMTAKLLRMGEAMPEGFGFSNTGSAFVYLIYESRGKAQSPKGVDEADAQVATQVIQGAAIIKSDIGGLTYNP